VTSADGDREGLPGALRIAELGIRVLHVEVADLREGDAHVRVAPEDVAARDCIHLGERRPEVLPARGRQLRAARPRVVQRPVRNQTVEVVAYAVAAVDVFDHEVVVHRFPVRYRLSALGAESRPVASAESFRKCDPSGSRFNLRLAVAVEVVALRES